MVSGGIGDHLFLQRVVSDSRVKGIGVRSGEIRVDDGPCRWLGEHGRGSSVDVPCLLEDPLRVGWRSFVEYGEDVTSVLEVDKLF